ncbi:unnamed protein product [Vitrella brassicaformis CCMP3155]|uniref:GCF C-terminal domain-containing protein n=3 Tax=Vitrella brassicaformis TaxID=1169539 RepID=A0A0G4ETX3_VITBC|nr:unnamed protein product [Vitrella brassicaformis CCMP3155]|eukprot:CEM02077.1 unnamed protein product [Vitrella brassicaformis CCMP3155]
MSSLFARRGFKKPDAKKLRASDEEEDEQDVQQAQPDASSAQAAAVAADGPGNVATKAAPKPSVCVAEEADEEIAFKVRKSKASKALSSRRKPIDEDAPSPTAAAGGDLPSPSPSPPPPPAPADKPPRGPPSVTSDGVTVTLRTTHSTDAQGDDEREMGGGGGGRYGPGSIRRQNRPASNIFSTAGKGRGVDEGMDEDMLERLRAASLEGEEEEEDMHGGQGGDEIRLTTASKIYTLDDDNDAEDDELGASAEELARLARAKREKLRQAASSAEEFISLDSSAVPLSATTPIDDIGSSDRLKKLSSKVQRQLGQAAPSASASASVQQDHPVRQNGRLPQSMDEDEDLLEGGAMALEQGVSQWELQQIRKARGRTAGEALTQPQYHYHHQQQPSFEEMPVSAPPPVVYGALPLPSSVPTAMVTIPSPDAALQGLQMRTHVLRSDAAKRRSRNEGMTKERADTAEMIDTLEKKLQKLDKDLDFFQRFEEYIEDLSGLLAVKSEPVNVALQTLELMEADFAKRRWNRRVQELDDELFQAGERHPKFQQENKDEKDEFGRSRAFHHNQARLQRIDRRQKRRNQQRQRIMAKSLGGQKQSDILEDGWVTSDDDQDDGKEQLVADRKKFCEAAQAIFRDASEDFRSVHHILERFKEFKTKHNDRYRASYCGMSLLEVLQPFVTLQLLWWDPFATGSAADAESAVWYGGRRLIGSATLEEFEWYELMVTYTDIDTQADGKEDPDGDLVPQLVFKAVFPRIKAWLEAYWDPTSLTQTKRCVELLNELLLFRADDEASTKPINEVLEAAVKRMTACIDDLLAFPQTSPSSLPEGPLSPLVVRQVWRALKVSRCAAEWQDVLSTNAIQQFVVKEVWQQRLARCLSASRPDDIDPLERYVMDLPLGWMVAGRPEGLGSCVQMCATMAVKHAQPSREGGLDMPRRAVKLLKRLQAYDEARDIQKRLGITDGI